MSKPRSLGKGVKYVLTGLGLFTVAFTGLGGVLILISWLLYFHKFMIVAALGSAVILAVAYMIGESFWREVMEEDKSVENKEEEAL